jgi:hypothetical protein
MIHDQYTYTTLSRQRKYQLRKKDKGLCIICGGKAINAKFCAYHASQASEINKNSQKKTKDVDKSNNL